MTGLLRSAAAFALLAASTSAWAACSVSPQSVIFGDYDPLTVAALDGVGNVNIDCDVQTTFIVSLSAGNGGISDRRMNAGAGQLHYNLYKDAARIFIWGDGLVPSVSATGINVDLPVYGRIPGGQNVPTGLYLDSITVTVTY